MPDPLFMCPRCPFEENKPRTLGFLREHLARMHLQLALWYCPKCREPFATPHMAYGHMRDKCKVDGSIATNQFTYNLLNVNLSRLIELHQLEKEAIYNTCRYLSQQKPPQTDNSCQTDPVAPPPPPPMPFLPPFFPSSGFPLPPFFPPPPVPSNEEEHLEEMEYFPVPPPFPILPPQAPPLNENQMQLENQENEGFSPLDPRLKLPSSTAPSNEEEQAQNEEKKFTVADVCYPDEPENPLISKNIEEPLEEQMENDQVEEESAEEEELQADQTVEEEIEQEPAEQVQREEEEHEIQETKPTVIIRPNMQDSPPVEIVGMGPFERICVPIKREEERSSRLYTPSSPEILPEKPPIKKVRFVEEHEIINFVSETNEEEEEEPPEEIRPKRRKNPPRAAKKS